VTQTTTEESFASGVPARTAVRAALDKHAYITPAAAAAEWDGLWTRCWLFAGLEADIPDEGDYFVYAIGRESIVVLRDDLDQVRAFYNFCQHRGDRSNR